MRKLSWKEHSLNCQVCSFLAVLMSGLMPRSTPTFWWMLRAIVSTSPLASWRAPVTSTCAGSPLMCRNATWSLDLGHTTAGFWTSRCLMWTYLHTYLMESGILLVRKLQPWKQLVPSLTVLVDSLFLVRNRVRKICSDKNIPNKTYFF